MAKHLTGYNGRPLPDLQAYGLKWDAIQRLIDEQAKLWKETRSVGLRMQEVEASIPALYQELQKDRAAAFRAGAPEPSAEKLEKAEGEIAQLKQRLGMLRLALEQSQYELEGVLQTHSGEYREDLEQRAAKAAAGVEKLAEKLRGALRELDELGALAQWLDNPGSGFGVGYVSEQGLDAILDNARRRVAGERVA